LAGEILSIARDQCPWPNSTRCGLARTENAPEPAELTPTRHSLRQAIARCDRARLEIEAAAIVVGRLNDLLSDFD
jgi:hypothetical protein